MEEKSRNILISEDKIKARIKELVQILNSTTGQEIICPILVKRKFYFYCDLVRAINIPVKIGFMTTSSYGDMKKALEMLRLLMTFQMI